MKVISAALAFIIAGALFAQTGAPATSSKSEQNTRSAAQQRKPPSSATEGAYRAAADSADAKFHRIQMNATRMHPDQTPTVFTEREINSFFADDRVELPQGVKRVQFTGTPGVVTTNALIDFDKITAGSQSSNPLMSLFSGVHEVQVASHGQGAGGEGRVHIDSVSIDGVGVPRVALQFFVDRYIRPRYPELGLDSRFDLPDRIDTATVGDHILTVTQK